MHRCRILALLASLTLVVVGCGEDGPKGPQPLSRVQSERLAQAAFSNMQSGGAKFEANSAFLGVDDNIALTLVGEVDWTNHVGRAVVRGGGPDAGLTEVYWEESFVLERRPAVDQIVASRGGPATPWIMRQPEPQVRQLDRMLGILIGLAAEQPDNAVLLQQDEMNVFVRPDELRGSSVEVLRFGERSLYWLDADDGTMLRFEGNSAGGNAPTIVDFLKQGRVEIPRPAPTDVISRESISEIYDAFAGS